MTFIKRPSFSLGKLLWGIVFAAFRRRAKKLVICLIEAAELACSNSLFFNGKPQASIVVRNPAIKSGYHSA